MELTPLKRSWFSELQTEAQLLFPVSKKFLTEDYSQKQLAQKFWYIKQYQMSEKKSTII